MIKSNIQSYRSLVLVQRRYYRTANFNSRNYYELLGIERTATQKEIKKAFYKLSKEYHPDSNSTDKSLHEKFIKINEAFSILSKPSSRMIYDQSLNPSSDSLHRSYSRQASSARYNGYPDNQGTYQRRTSTDAFSWGTPPYYKAYERFHRRTEFSGQRTKSYHYGAQSSPFSTSNDVFAPITVILMIIGLGMFLHSLQWRAMRVADSQYRMDPKSRHYLAYREWQRLHSVKETDLDAAKISSSILTDDNK